MIYLIGSLKNPEIPKIAERLRQQLGVEVFDSWYSPGPEADDFLRDHLRFRGLSYPEAMEEHAVRHIFEFDKTHIDRADTVVLVMPAGKSGHLELGYAIGKGKKGYILFDKEPERFDVMHRFADKVFLSIEDLIKQLSIDALQDWVQKGRLKDDERSEMGPVPSGNGPVCGYCKQRPIYENGRCHSCAQQLRDLGWLQRVP